MLRLLAAGASRQDFSSFLQMDREGVNKTNLRILPWSMCNESLIFIISAFGWDDYRGIFISNTINIPPPKFHCDYITFKVLNENILEKGREI